MKILRLLVIAILTISFAGCSSDDGGSATLSGTWYLRNVQGGLDGTNDNFAEGVITWDFDTSTQTFEVMNNNSNDELEDVLPSGIYPYEIVENLSTPELCEKVFMIDEVNFGCYNLATQQLTIGSVENDGFLITLRK